VRDLLRSYKVNEGAANAPNASLGGGRAPFRRNEEREWNAQVFDKPCKAISFGKRNPTVPTLAVDHHRHNLSPA